MPSVNFCMAFVDKVVCRLLLEFSLPIQVVVASIFTNSFLLDIRKIYRSPLTFRMGLVEKSS